jgi:solute:Na+ symporter, SSS family
VAITFAEFAGQLGSLVEAVNQIGSLFYGTMLGIFLLAFYFKRVSGTPAFIGALIGEAAVIITWRTTEVAFLWYNAIGCLVAIGAALLLSPLFPRKPEAPATVGARV